MGHSGLPELAGKGKLTGKVKLDYCAGCTDAMVCIMKVPRWGNFWM